MNLVEVHITKIIQPPQQISIADGNMWEMVVETDSHGKHGQRTIREDSLREMKKYEVGYYWLE